MKAFLRANDPLMWDVVLHGINVDPPPPPPRVIIPPPAQEDPLADNAPGRNVPPPPRYDLYDDIIEKRTAFDAKAIHALYCALSPTQYNRISSCETAKAIWDRLQVTYEGTERVRETKTNLLLGQYEGFKMKADESVTSMFNRFTDIVNGLANQGKSLGEEEKVNKLLRALTKDWNNIKTSIRETQRIAPLGVDEIIGTLLSYEAENLHENPEPKGKQLALKTNSASDNSDSDNEENDEELALMVRKFKRMAKRGKFYKDKKPWKKNQEKGESKDVICFECRKKGHIKPNCPLLNKKKGKFEKNKKALKAESWSDSECEESDHEESAYICLMAKTDSDSESEPEVNTLDMTPEVTEYITELCSGYKQALKRISELKKENSKLRLQDIIEKEKFATLEKEISNLKESQDVLSNENFELNERLTKIIEKFSRGSLNLRKILSIQIPAHNKKGLGHTKVFCKKGFPEYDERRKQRPKKKAYTEHFKKNFTKPSGQKKFNCSNCNGSDHFKPDCPLVWRPVLKEILKFAPETNEKVTSKANMRGPKKAWVPKKT